MKTETWVRLAAIGTTLLTGLILLCLLIRYLTGILLPFAAAALIASVLRPAAVRIRARTRIPEKLGGTVLILAAVFLLAVAILGIGICLYRSMRDFFSLLTTELDDPNSPISRFLFTLSGDRLFPTSSRFASLSRMLTDVLRNAVSSASSALTSAAGSILLELPRLLLSLLISVIAMFYLFFDAKMLSAQLRFFFGSSTVERAQRILFETKRILGICLRNNFLLFLLTFSELLSGFLLMNVTHPVRNSLLVAFVDLLPVLGAGSVLLPWSLFSFLSGSPGRGIGLLLLSGVMYVIRQLAESRLLSTSVGVHPLFSLFAVYAGFRLIGFAGVLLAPLVLSGIKAILESVRNAPADDLQKKDAA